MGQQVDLVGEPVRVAVRVAVEAGRNVAGGGAFSLGSSRWSNENGDELPDAEHREGSAKLGFQPFHEDAVERRSRKTVLIAAGAPFAVTVGIAGPAAYAKRTSASVLRPSTP